MNKSTLFQRLNRNQQRGSKPRCHMLTHGSAECVAERLTQLVAPWGHVRPTDKWMPQGFENTQEAQLHNSPRLLSEDISERLRSWWLSVFTPNVNTPNWDIASTCLIDGKPGLMLVEAKAHEEELNGESIGRRLDHNSTKERIQNHEQIGRAIQLANAGLNKITPIRTWNLSRDSHYQIANRFAWAWELTALGIPVILVYLGFLNANEMLDKGNIFETSVDWQTLVLSHSQSIIPADVWNTKISNQGVALIPLIKAIEWPLV